MQGDVKIRLTRFIKYLGIGQKAFADKVGLSAGFVNSIRVSIQPKTLEKIALVYPELNTSWLLTGEGEMLRSFTQTVGNIQGNATGVNVNGNVNVSASIDKLIDEIAAQRKMTEKAQEQIDRLLTIIEKK